MIQVLVFLRKLTCTVKIITAFGKPKFKGLTGVFVDIILLWSNTISGIKPERAATDIVFFRLT